MRETIYLLKYSVSKGSYNYAEAMKQFFRKYPEHVNKLANGLVVFYTPYSLVEFANILAEYKRYLILDFVFKIDITEQLDDPIIKSVYEKVGKKYSQQAEQRYRKMCSLIWKYLHGKNPSLKPRIMEWITPARLSVLLKEGYLRGVSPVILQMFVQLAKMAQKEIGIETESPCSLEDIIDQKLSELDD